MLVLVEDAAESVSSEEVKLIELAWFGKRFGAGRSGAPFKLRWGPVGVEHHHDPGVGQDDVEQVGEPPVPVPDQEPSSDRLVGDPSRPEPGCGPAGRRVPGRDRFEEVAGQEALGLGLQEAGPGRGRSVRAQDRSRPPSRSPTP